MRPRMLLFVLSTAAAAFATPATAAPFAFNTGNLDGRIGVATRPPNGVPFEIETGDDFVLSDRTRIGGASFTGLLPAGVGAGAIDEVVVEIYRVFPKDSLNPPSGHVPTRTNSPSDAALDSRDSATAALSFSATLVQPAFTALNSVQPGGIHPIPNQTTAGNGAAAGNAFRFDVTFATPFDLQPDHYFFVPQVALSTGEFLWLSSARPIVAPGTPFPPNVQDLQAWTRDELLAPDWLRVGTDIVGGTTFNLAFSLSGETVPAVPEPESWALMAAGLALLGGLGRRRARDAGG